MSESQLSKQPRRHSLRADDDADEATKEHSAAALNHNEGLDDAPRSPDGGNGLVHLSKSSPQIPTPTTLAAARRTPKHDSPTDERPAKRQRTLSATTPRSARKPKPISPPWKRIEADGPTSYTENGRRKSGRINTAVAETPQPTARKPRQASSVRKAAANSPTKSREHTSRSNAKVGKRSNDGESLSGRGHGSVRSAKRSSKLRTSSTRLTQGTSLSPEPESRRQSSRVRQSARSQAAHRSAEDPMSVSGNSYTQHSSPRIRLRVSRGGNTPLVHAAQAPKRPKLGANFEDFWRQAGSVSVDAGGLQSSEDGAIYTDEMARKDARTVLRIEEEVEDGGLLSSRRCSLFAPETTEMPARQWARQDHMVKAMSNFRRLMVMEQQRHRTIAKRIAEACRDEWLRRRPKSQEEVEAEARERWRNTYRYSVMRAIGGLWENVRAEANRQRFEEWEAAEQRRVKAALNEAVNLSEQKLQARQLGLDSEMASLADLDTDGSVNDDPLDDDSQSDTADTRSSDLTDSDNMSTTDDDEPEAGEADVADEGLTQDQLRVKYAGANIKSASPTDANMSTKLGTSVSSDESVDMDDDLGESDQTEDSDPANEGRRNGTNADSEDSDGSDDDHDDGAPNGLLNMLFDDSELKELSAEAPGTEHMTGAPEVGDDGTPSSLAPASTRLDSAPDEQLNTNTSTEGDAPVSTVLHEESEKPICQETSPDAKSTMNYEQDQDKARLISEESHKQNTEVPFLLRGTLREYQHQGLDWLAGLYANNTNGILADEMGLGKTIQTIALLAHLACQHEVWGPHLVVVPTSVMLNWEMEFKKWCPGFKILAYYGSQEERKRKRQGWNNDDMWNVCITSYQLVLQDQQVFKRRRWHYLVLDEAHNIKNFKSQRWQTLLGFNTQARLLLTGTPLQNNLTELWSLLFFLMPAQNGVGGFADLEEFHDWFHKPESQILENGREQMDDEALAIISKLHKVLRPYLLRRLKADVEKQMPGKYEHVEFCRLSKRQRELYDGFLSRADTKNTLASGNYMSIINCLMQLRKVCNHPDLFVDRQIVTSLRMQKSVPALYESTVRTLTQGLLRPEPMSKVDLGFLNLVPAQYESIPRAVADQIAKLSLSTDLLDYRETQRVRARNAYVNLDPTTVTSSIVYIESAFRWGRFEELQHCVYLNALRRQRTPIYGKDVVQLLTIDAGERLRKPRPKAARGLLAWFEQTSSTVGSMALSLEQRAERMRTAIEKFSCVTPAVVTCDIGEVVLGRRAAHAFSERDLQISKPKKWTPWMEKQSPLDPWHEARLRLSIQFPDKRLLQYDCGKLQVLDRLLRKLQAGGHRALIFTQMTKVLDILEQFLNIHGHKYLRLDGATKVEQRQILTDRFNNDPRILCFILSTRSGGLGINLTGADTVIFYDQDWNPAMDKQCQDRCHRIGQTRDVHIYRLVSEHTIEANILRKASQKQMLDDVVIQEGTFTTDAFKQMSVRDLLREKVDTFSEGVSAADAALDRVLGGSDGETNQRKVGRVLEQAEDREDIDAARVAEREIEADDADFVENTSLVTPEDSNGRNATSAVRDIDAEDQATEGIMQDPNAWGAPMGTIDDFMLRTMADAVKDTKLELPRDKKKSKKKGRDTRKR